MIGEADRRRDGASGRPLFLRPVPGLHIDDDGRRLFGGSPLRMIRLSDIGADLVRAWFDGDPVGPVHAHRSLAARLVEGDLATASSRTAKAETFVGTSAEVRFTDSADRWSTTIIVPVKDDPDGLAATLNSLLSGPVELPASGRDSVTLADRLEIVVVDDGSAVPIEIPDHAGGEAIGRRRVAVVRRSTSAGPGNARNLGFTSSSGRRGASRIAGKEAARALIFVDAGVVISPGQIGALVNELMVGPTVAVAPRIRSGSGRSWLARYESRWSPLDLGPVPGLVGVGRRLSYVPSTCLAVRSEAFSAAGGFDPGLRYGEDVDLVWRLASQGWVRYLANVEATHPPRSTLLGFIRQRFGYGSSAGPLARRHGHAVAPARFDPTSAAVWLGAVAGLRVPAVLVASGAMIRHYRSLRRLELTADRSAAAVAESWSARLAGTAMAAARTWWPLALGSLVARRRFSTGSALLALGWLRRLQRAELQAPTTDGPTGPATVSVGERLVDVVLGVIDDSVYAAGVWYGALKSRTTLPLLPQLTRGSGRAKGAPGKGEPCVPATGRSADRATGR